MYPLSAETTVDAGSKQAAEGEPVDVEPAGQPTAPEPEPGTGGGTTVAGQPAAETAGVAATEPLQAPVSPLANYMLGTWAGCISCIRKSAMALERHEVFFF